GVAMHDWSPGSPSEPLSDSASYPASYPTSYPASYEDEKVVFRVQPVLTKVTVSYAIATIFSLATAAVIGHFAAPFWVVLAAAAVSFLTPVVRHLQRNQVSYTLTNSRIEVESGLWSKKVRVIPLHNVQDVTAQASLAERIVGIGDVVI